jgi:hypothetical protein
MMKRLIVVGFLVSTLSSCMLTASTPSGIREFYRGQTGLVTTGKSKPNVEDEYHKTQRHAETENTVRITLGKGE